MEGDNVGAAIARHVGGMAYAGVAEGKPAMIRSETGGACHLNNAVKRLDSIPTWRCCRTAACAMASLYSAIGISGSMAP